jgi:hypothetical protein
MLFTTGLVAAILVAAVPSAGAARRAFDASPFLSFARAFPSSGTDRLRPGAERVIAEIRWRRTASAGVTVLVSPAYAADPSTGERWVAFFDSLIHGSELSRLTAYVASPAEIDRICPDALGCYDDDRMWISDVANGGVSPQEIAAHEYGHHVAFNRVNPPWIAVEWGTKRWASAMNVCSRALAGTAYPGDEGGFYTLNPGEAFAETYRVLNGYGVDDWRVADPSFRPTQAALAATRADVVDPWTGPVSQTIRVRFTHGRTWSGVVSTPLDGSLAVATTTGGVDLQLLSADRRTVLASGSWGPSGGKAVGYQVCGRRAFVLRVTTSGPRRLTVRVTKP